MPTNPGPFGGFIRIDQLELFAQVGVPEAERATPQRLVANIDIWPVGDLRELHDEIERTVDYSAVAAAARTFAAEHPHKLIETLAAALANHLLARFPIRLITIELRKFALADANYVAVTLSRRAAAEGDERAK